MRFERLKILVTAFLVILAAIENSFAAMAAQYEIDIQSPDSVNIGHSFNIVFSINSNTNVKAIQFNVVYNTKFVSFKKALATQSGEINTNENDDGKLGIIVLFDDVLKSGNVINLTFTAKTGNTSSRQTLEFEFVQAVDASLNDISLRIPNKITIGIVKKGDQSETDGKQSIGRESSNLQNSSSKEKQKTTSSTKVDSQKTDSNLAGRNSNSESSVFNEADRGKTNNKSEEKNKDKTASISQIGSGNNTGILDLKDDKVKYILAGVGGTISVCGILFVVFRLGQLSKRKPEADKFFPKDDINNK